MSDVEIRELDQQLGETVLRDCLARQREVRLTVTGNCTRPCLRAGDSVVIADSRRRGPRLGDVVLTAGPRGLRLHRLVWAPPRAFGLQWRTKADRAPSMDARLDPDDVLGSVVAVRDGTAPPRWPWPVWRSIGVAVLGRLRVACGRAPLS